MFSGEVFSIDLHRWWHLDMRQRRRSCVISGCFLIPRRISEKFEQMSKSNLSVNLKIRLFETTTCCKSKPRDVVNFSATRTRLLSSIINIFSWNFYRSATFYKGYTPVKFPEKSAIGNVVKYVGTGCASNRPHGALKSSQFLNSWLGLNFDGILTNFSSQIVKFYGLLLAARFESNRFDWFCHAGRNGWLGIEAGNEQALAEIRKIL